MWLQFELEEAINASNVTNVTFELNASSRNKYAPKVFHPE